ncbi:RNA polymerase sigma factor [Acetivibrio clariflavus]|uniref:RNA polymerase sigma factor, sigma-70 family n=1 Tax=Acetivibrio clariflavus (strain DSM 19732 / NBRC 101661 / EBR45) TaxID=720554 RepID=G8LUW0_ACECE|nr:sigma-70 family RNA polymerase sigma factor [Acetivibrio clariflavus]AEV68490.1 RNA polymerase sigma factor, sigma-70 family [Acetivibrio clariflavus DSM 19732]
MEDNHIIKLYFDRSESAISETANKYGRYCYSISYNILHNHEDAEECVNDTYIKAWESIPPNRPSSLSAYLGKITRYLSLNKYEKYTAQKRGLGQVQAVLDELENFIPTFSSTEQKIDDMALVETLNGFLASLPVETRKIFMRRYWYFSSIKEIAKDYGISQSKVKMTLLRARNELKRHLEKEGVML